MTMGIDMPAAMHSNPERLVEANLAFARQIAMALVRQLPRRIDAEELVSDAYLGLVEAAESFDRNRGSVFRSFAARRIRGAIIDGIRQRQHSRRVVPDPTLASIDVTITGRSEREAALSETIPADTSGGTTAVEIREIVQHIMLKLDPRARECVRRCWMEDARQVDVALELGICQPLVSRTLEAAKRKARELFPEEVGCG